MEAEEKHPTERESPRLHRVEHANGIRYIRENLDHAANLYVQELYADDPALVKFPSRIYVKPVAVKENNEFHFKITGDADLAGRQYLLRITETGSAILKHGPFHF